MMSINGGDLNIRSTSFEHNDFDGGSGGAAGGGNHSWIAVRNGGRIGLKNADFSRNTDCGFDVDDGTLSFEGCSFRNHSHSGSSFCRGDNGGAVSFERATFSGFSTSGHSMIRVEGADLSVSDSVFTGGDHSAGNRGAHWVSISDNATAEFSGSNFTKNVDSDFYVSDDADVTFTDCQFLDNEQTEANASIITVDPSGNTVHIDGSTFSGNTGFKWAVLSNDWAADIVVSDSEFTDNDDVVYDIESQGMLEYELSFRDMFCYQTFCGLCFSKLTKNVMYHGTELGL